jgi:hypothetical protein
MHFILARSALLRAGPRRKEEGFRFPFPAVKTAGYYQSSPFGDCARAFGREEGAFALRTRHLPSLALLAAGHAGLLSSVPGGTGAWWG